MYTVDLVQIIEKMNLENCTPSIDIKKIKVSQPDVIDRLYSWRGL